MSKSNDNIPADEVLLAEAIAAARARGLTGTTGALYRNAIGRQLVNPRSAVACCALGAIRLLPQRSRYAPLHGVVSGNDTHYEWDPDQPDAGESLGWAFRCAMEDA